MRYTMIRDDETGKPKRLEHDGHTIWEYDGGGFSTDDDEMLKAILDSANFGQPQKDALRALLGLYDTEFE